MLRPSTRTAPQAPQQGREQPPVWLEVEVLEQRLLRRARAATCAWPRGVGEALQGGPPRVHVDFFFLAQQGLGASRAATHRLAAPYTLPRTEAAARRRYRPAATAAAVPQPRAAPRPAASGAATAAATPPRQQAPRSRPLALGSVWARDSAVERARPHHPCPCRAMACRRLPVTASARQTRVAAVPRRPRPTVRSCRSPQTSRRRCSTGCPPCSRQAAPTPRFAASHHRRFL